MGEPYDSGAAYSDLKEENKRLHKDIADLKTKIWELEVSQSIRRLAQTVDTYTAGRMEGEQVARKQMREENALLWEYWLMNERPLGTISDEDLKRYEEVRKELWDRRTTQTEEETR